MDRPTGKKELDIHPDKLRYSSYAVLTGMGLVILTHLIRPNLTGDKSVINFIFGVLPNFGGAFALPFIFMIMFQSKISRINFSVKTTFFLSVSITLFVLILWEFLQFIIWNYPVDIYDLIMTLAGVLSAVIYFIVLL